MSTTTAPSLGTAFLAELEQELEGTRRVLDRIPEDQLAWKPHAKCRTVGELALHIANVPGVFADMLTVEEFQLPDFDEQQDPSPATKAEILGALDEAAAKIRAVLDGMSDADFGTMWRVVKGDREIMALPKAAVARSFLLNHWYHHRGQLTVYLRMLDVPVPSVYGPTADENPFA
jgi:uncharacterized damage-inducible protein DinB